MKIITISREFGSGGRELGKRLADELGFDYYDRQVISAIAQSQGLNENYVENVLENNALQTVPITFRHSFGVPMIMNAPPTSLLLEQTRVIENIAKQGKNCIIVGRNADIILEKYHPFSIFVCAKEEAKLKRCMERAQQGENLSKKQLLQNMRRIDKNRAMSREIICNHKWGDPSAYDMTVNTTNRDIKKLVFAVANYVKQLINDQD